MGMLKQMSKILIQRLLDKIREYQGAEIRIMEVCGTHTQSIAKNAIKPLLPNEIKLLSGPGCPVCVTPEIYIDNAINILHYNHVILVTFGDLMKVKGSSESLDTQRIKGKKAEIIYSPFDVIKIAQDNPDKLIVFLAIGFETTAPLIASIIKISEEKKIHNIKFLMSLKVMPPILREILKRQRNELNGIICPGHVATIMGEKYFQFIADEFNISSIICGFEALDIICGIYLIMKNIRDGQVSKLNNIYKKCVYPQGNIKAKKLMNEVFEVKAGLWRGIGFIEDSELVLSRKYNKYNAAVEFQLDDAIGNTDSLCDCSHILLGDKAPVECNLFGKVCNPENPKGPCMVSSEGACFINYRYGG